MTLSNGLELTGLHHVSAVTSNIEGNRDFYTRALGMRIVKKSVNQDATDVYHLFYADGLGTPGTDVTFFDFQHTAPNHPGSGEIQEIALRVSGIDSLTYWQQRFDTLGIQHSTITTRAGRKALPFTDPEGQRLALIEDGGDAAAIPGGQPWELSTVPVEYGIKGLGAISISTARPDATLRVLTEIMGFRVIEDTPDAAVPGNRIVTLETGKGGPGGLFIVHVTTNAPRAHLGHGGVHHIAFRVPTFKEHDKWQRYLEEAGFHVTPVIDRFYFKAMYFREPGGVLYEISSDGPGFATDEPLESLGEKLALPPFFEDRRAEIEASIRPLDTGKHVTTTEYGLPIPEVSNAR
ncbi:MAG: ring-cleaving dioxygenase [Thermomicrobiales bacterium]